MVHPELRAGRCGPLRPVRPGRHHAGEGRVLQRRAGEDRLIHRGREVPDVVEARRARVRRRRHPERPRLRVRERVEAGERAAAGIDRERRGGVVARGEQRRPEQGVPGVRAARDEPLLVRLHLGRERRHDDPALEVTALDHRQRRHHLRQRRDRPPDARAARSEHATRRGVDRDERRRQHLRRCRDGSRCRHGRPRHRDHDKGEYEQSAAQSTHPGDCDRRGGAHPRQAHRSAASACYAAAARNA